MLDIFRNSQKNLDHAEYNLINDYRHNDQGKRKRIPKSKTEGVQKPPGKNYEDKIWRLFHNMGAQYLNTDKRDFEFDLSEYKDYLPGKAQIDVLGIFQDKFILMCECATSKTEPPPRGNSHLTSKVNKIEKYKSAVQKRIKKIFGEKGSELQPIWIMATDGISWQPKHKSQLLKSDLIILSEQEIDYLNDCYEISENPFFTFNQFLGFFKSSAGYYDPLEVVAIRTDAKGAESFTFATDPKTMMQMSVVAHRKAKNIYEADGLKKDHYQRVLSKKRLKDIGSFLEDNNKPFKNNILVSYRGEPRGWKFEPLEKGADRGGVLKIAGRPGTFHIIDGQHRLFGYAAVSDTSILENHEVIVTVFKDIDEATEANLFIDINKKQVSVNPSLLKEIEEFIGYTRTGKERIAQMSTALLYPLREDANSPFNNPVKTIKDAEAVRSKAKLTPVQISNYLAQSSLLGVTDFTDGYCAPLNASSANDYYKTIENARVLLFNYFQGIQDVLRKDWFEQTQDGKNQIKKDGAVHNPFIGGLIFLLERFIRKSFADAEYHSHLIPPNKILEKTLPYREHLIKSLATMSREDKFNFFEDLSQFRGTSGPKRVLAQLVDKFFKDEGFPELVSKEDAKHLISDDGGKTPAALIAELEEYKKELNQLKNSSGTPNLQAAQLEKQFKTYLHAILKKLLEKDGLSDYWMIIQASFVEIHLKVEKLKSDRMSVSGPEGAAGSQMGWCNWTDLRTIIAEKNFWKKNVTPEQCEMIEDFFSIKPFDKKDEVNVTKASYQWITLMNNLRALDGAGHSGIDGDPEKTTPLEKEQFIYYSEILTERSKQIDIYLSK